MQKILFCYSHREFIDMIEKLGWKEKPTPGFSTISIISKLNDGLEHYFNDNIENNINLDFDDVSPEHWWENNDFYDDALINFINNMPENIFFDIDIDELFTHLHAMNYNQAFKLVKFIDERINAGDNIYIHCSAGASRSQGVVRYILDTYKDIDWVTRDDNPCLTPNYHVVRMLKRAYNYLNN